MTHQTHVRQAPIVEGRVRTPRRDVTEYLELEDLLAAAEAALAGPPSVRDIGLLQAAATRPRASVGDDAYPDLDHKAAALLHSLVTGHPLVDGTKRLVWLPCACSTG
jgi:death on curing protein